MYKEKVENLKEGNRWSKKWSKAKMLEQKGMEERQEANQLT